LHCFQSSSSALRVFSAKAALVRGPVSVRYPTRGVPCCALCSYT
jgi:hypothetical protein